jgi:hypothetical protein
MNNCRANSLVHLIVLNSEEYNYFSRSKIILLSFLIDLKAMQKLEHSISQRPYYRTIDSVYSEEINQAINWLTSWEIEDIGERFMPGTKPRFSPLFVITPEENDIIIDTLLEYGNMEINTKILNMKRVKHTNELEMVNLT